MTNLELQNKLKQFKDDMEIAVSIPNDEACYYSNAESLTLIEDEGNELLTIKG